jgi:hypothetical protein
MLRRGPADRWATRLLRLYPRRWRERYLAEVTALLEEHHVTLRTLVDLLGGALDARLTRQGMSERSINPMRSTRSLRHAQLTVFWLFPVFLIAVLYRTSQMIDWNEPGPIGSYFGLVLRYPVLNVLAATVGIATALALLALLIGGLLLMGSRGWMQRAYVGVCVLATIAGPVLFFSVKSLEGMLATVAVLELLAGALLVLLIRSEVPDTNQAQPARRGIWWGSFVASTVVVGGMSVALVAISVWAGIIWAQTHDLEPNALVAAAAAAVALIALGWGVASFRTAPRTPSATA